MAVDDEVLPRPAYDPVGSLVRPLKRLLYSVHPDKDVCAGVEVLEDEGLGRGHSGLHRLQVPHGVFQAG